VTDIAAGTALDLTAADSELHEVLADRPDVTGFLQQLAALCAALVPRASCAVTMRRGRQAATVASSDEFAWQVGEIQYGRGQGPCLQALRTGARVEVRDLATDDRWGEYRLHALAAGVRSCVSLPLTVKDATIGAVSLYSRTRDSFGKKDVRRAEALTLQAATALTLLLRPCGDDVKELRRKLDEAQETLRTIRAGGFDALIIDTGSSAAEQHGRARRAVGTVPQGRVRPYPAGTERMGSA
jgi:transcriptional regulator with GAF, ATPase, and Fis domain